MNDQWPEWSKRCWETGKVRQEVDKAIDQALDRLVDEVAAAEYARITDRVNQDATSTTYAWLDDARAVRMARELAKEYGYADLQCNADGVQCDVMNDAKGWIVEGKGDTLLAAVFDAREKASKKSKPAALDPVAIYERLADRGLTITDGNCGWFLERDFVADCGGDPAEAEMALHRDAAFRKIAAETSSASAMWLYDGRF